MTKNKLTFTLTAEQASTLRQALMLAEEQYKAGANEAAKEATTSVPHTMIQEYFETRAKDCRELIVLFMPPGSRRRKAKR